MNSKTWSLLRDDDPDNNGGGGVDTGLDTPAAGDELLDITDKTGTNGADLTKKTVDPVKKEHSTEDLLAAADRIVERRMAAAQPRQKDPELTQEQLDKLLNPVRVSREDMAEIFGIEDPATISDKRLQKMQALLNATVKNSTSMAHLMQEQRMRKLMEDAGPMQSFYQEQQAQAQKTNFFKAHPKLEKFPKFVAFAASQVQARNADGSEKTVKTVIDEVASFVKDLLKESNIDLDADDNSDATVTTQATGGSKVPTMASMQTPGRSGGGTKKGGSNNPDADIYS